MYASSFTFTAVLDAEKKTLEVSSPEKHLNKKTDHKYYDISLTNNICNL